MFVKIKTVPRIRNKNTKKVHTQLDEYIHIGWVMVVNVKKTVLIQEKYNMRKMCFKKAW